MVPILGQIKSFVETLNNTSVFSSDRTGTDTAQTIFFMSVKLNSTTPVPVKGFDSPRSDVSLCTDTGEGYLEHL